MERLAQQITNLIQTNNPKLSDLEIKKIKFGLECFFGEVTKLIIYLVIFSTLSLTKHFLIATLFFCIPRMPAGGFHEDTYWRCFFTSLMIFSAIAIGGSRFFLNWPIRFALILITLILIWIYAPVDHPNKPIISLERRKRLKYFSLAATAVLVGISFIIPEKYAATATFALLCEALSLPIGELSKRRFTNEAINR
ncbi:accessory gene regulator B [Geosporobacter subterraneus DSM 17957]|uniref:Accessory gene regulator B n=1 Tax=Geosporobacter subterraneus DSM 17957 TaxID=1121919 RepID=A0A1M6I9S7_9FIRM|nr:accessory gene regulator B family protein [Geosporobacter subterraneus]SHJ31183.1 accessory gene regulator B [Geosporobacter subterraneus DSM 17957]